LIFAVKSLSHDLTDFVTGP